MDFAEFRGTARFDIRRRLGAGGMGVVYHAYDTRRREDVALKTLLRADPTSLYLLKQEFRNLADVAHENLVSLYELLYDEGHWFFTMELLDGAVDVLDYIREGSGTRPGGASEAHLSAMTQEVTTRTTARTEAHAPAVSPTQIARLRHALAQSARGLTALHAKGFLHRDVKPSNILVTPQHRVVIVDFGLSRSAAQADETLYGPIFGTPLYMAPERAIGDNLSAALDWYAVGVIMYEALTGRPPFTGSAMDMLVAKHDVDPQPPSASVPDVPPDLDQLCSALLRRDPAMRPSGDDLLRALKPDSIPPVVQTGSASRDIRSAAESKTRLVGRERELTLLESMYRTTLSGSAVTVGVHGSSGVGKSALVRHFLSRVQEGDPRTLVLSARCYEREAVPYKGVDGIVDRLSHHLLSLAPSEARGLLPRGTAALARLFPVLRRVEAIAADALDAESDPLLLRRAAFATLRELLVRMADRGPVVLAIDDLQWADADSIALLEELMRPPRVPPVMLIFTFRSEALAVRAFLQNFVNRPGEREQHLLELHGLTPHDSRALVLELLGGAAASARDAALDVIGRESDGNPFLIEQLAGAVASAVDESPTPSAISLRDLVGRRIQLLPPAARDLLEVLAVAGRPMPADMLCRAARVNDAVGPIVSALRASQMISGPGSAGHLEIYHDRVRETLLSGLSRDRARDLHERLVKVWEDITDVDPETLYEHHLGAGHFDQAANAAFAAARRAATALAFDRAALFYRLSLEVSDLPPTERLHRTTLLAEALARAGRTREAAHAFLEAAKASTSDTAVLNLRRQAAEQLLFGGYIDEGVEVVRDVLDAFGIRLPRGPRHALLALLWRRAQLRARGLSFVERPPELIRDEDVLKIDAHYAVATGLGLVDLVSGAYFQSTQLLLALRTGEPYRVSRALAIEAASVATGGGPAREHAANILRAAEGLARRIEVPHALGLCSLAGGIAAFLCGQWKKCTKLCDEANTIFRESGTGGTWEVTNATLFAISGMQMQGEVATMASRIGTVLPAARDRGNVYIVNDVQTRFNIMWLAAGDAEGAKREVEEALAQWSNRGFHRQHYNAMRALVEVELYMNRAEDAANIVSTYWSALHKSLLMRVQVLRLEAYALRARVMVALAAVQPSDRRRLLGLAAADVRSISRESMFWSDPMAALIKAAISRLEGRLDQAVGELVRAVDGFELAGMGLYANAARLALGQMKNGSQGEGLISEARAWMKMQKIHNPEAIARLLAPALIEGDSP